MNNLNKLDTSKTDSVLTSFESLVKPKYKESAHTLSKLNVLLLGVPGSGKTTLAEMLNRLNPNINYISLGKISRALPPSSKERQELDALFKKGAPVGKSEFFLDLVNPHITQTQICGEGFILDGIPKKAEEAIALVDWLEEKNISIDLIISCELPTYDAYERIKARPKRNGDPDTIEIFTNRVSRYLKDLDFFKIYLSSRLKADVLVLDTGKHNKESALEYTLLNILKRTDTKKQSTCTQSTELERLLTENIYNKEELFKLYGRYFDDLFPLAKNHSVLDKKTVQRLFIEKYPNLKKTPKFLKRLVDNYFATTYTALEHLVDSLIEEVEARPAKPYDVFLQQYKLKRTIQRLQDQMVANKNLHELIDQEFDENEEEFAYLNTYFKESIRELVALQANLWGQFTSNHMLFTEDLNYRQASNGKPDSHHSLLPYTNNPMAFSANAMGDYVPFVEAVSAVKHHGYTSTFGFIHFMGMSDTGEMYGVEYPIVMHDKKLTDLHDENINKALHIIESFFSNHDLWHNLLPVYARHFILHHPFAPISYGGRLENYERFGKSFRYLKEEYEIGLAAAHTRTQQERFRGNSAYERKQVLYLLGACKYIKAIDDPKIRDYLACRLANKAFIVFPPGHQIHKHIADWMDSQELPTMSLYQEDVSELFESQNLGDIYTANPKKEDRESGSEYVYETLSEVRRRILNDGVAILSNEEKAMWLSIQSTQRKTLRGHMYKAHGKRGFTTSEKELGDPRELVSIQYNVIKKDWEDYQYRMWARSENQQLCYLVYKLIQEDSLPLKELDSLLHALVTTTYSYTNHSLLEAARDLRTKHPHSQTAATIEQVITRYTHLKSRERDYQEKLQTTYIKAAKALTDSQMDIK